MQDTFVREFALRRTPLWSPGLTLLSTMTLGCLLHAVLGGGRPDGVEPQNLGLVGLLLCLGLWTLGRRLLVRLRPLPPICFDETAAVLPRHAESWRRRRLPYDQILAVHLLGSPPRQHLVVEARGALVHLPQQVFVDPGALARLHQELRRRIAALPSGTAQLQRTQQARQQTAARLHGGSLLTQGCIGLIAVLFANVCLRGDAERPLGLLRWGAQSPLCSGAAQAYRLLLANFLHAGAWLAPWAWIQLSLLALALYYVGTLVERMLGWARTAVLLCACGLAASLSLHLGGTQVLSCGATGLLFGLLGAYGMLGWRLAEGLPLGLRQPPRWWISVGLFGLLLPLFWSVPTLLAHLGSGLCGGLLALAMLGRQRQLPGPSGAAWRGLGAACLLGVTASVGMGVRLAATAPPTYERDLLQAALAAPDSSPALLGQMAHLWALDRDVPGDDLAVAEAAVAQALERQPQDAALRDTLALVQWRRGRPAEALLTQQQAVRQSEPLDPRMVGRLATLLAEQRPAPPAGTPLRLDAQAAQIELAVQPELQAQASEWCARLWLGERAVAALYIELAPNTARLQMGNTLLRALLSQADAAGPARLETLIGAPSPQGGRGKTRWTLAPLLSL